VRPVVVVRRLYAALRASDRSAYRRLCHPAVEWRFMTGFPHGGTRIGHAAVFEGVFPALMRDFDRWSLEVDEVLDTGAVVVGLGRYRGRARATGRRFVAEFVHVFRIRAGRIVRVQQFTDTALIVGALGDPPRSRRVTEKRKNGLSNDRWPGPVTGASRGDDW
jgi:ketosteroid isomerase-like protein